MLPKPGVITHATMLLLSTYGGTFATNDILALQARVDQPRPDPALNTHPVRNARQGQHYNYNWDVKTRGIPDNVRGLKNFHDCSK